MIRLVGIDLPKNKRIEYALTYIYGIGIISARKIVKLSNSRIRSVVPTPNLFV